jgi:hypothetical protein
VNGSASCSSPGRSGSSKSGFLVTRRSGDRFFRFMGREYEQAKERQQGGRQSRQDPLGRDDPRGALRASPRAVAKRSRRGAATAYRKGPKSEALKMKPATTIRRAEICDDEACGHESCAQSRADARAKCERCHRYAGFDRALEKNPDGPGVVRACLEREFKQTVVNAVFIREHIPPYGWFRIEMACGHNTFLKLMSGSMVKFPKRIRCSECKHLLRDGYGNRRLMPMKSLQRGRDGVIR